MKEADFRQDFGLGQEVGSSILAILTSPWKHLSQDFAYCLDNFVFSVLLAPHCTTIDLNTGIY